MTKPPNIESIEAATGKSWQEWVILLDGMGARDLSHPDIAAKAQAELEGNIESAGWWAQGVTVAYEQHIGRREPGQRSDGSYEFSVSKTYDSDKDSVFAGLLERFEGLTEFRSVPITNMRQSVTPVRSYWKADCDDGTKVTFAVESRGDKAVLVVTHANIQDVASRDEWREFWRGFLKET